MSLAQSQTWQREKERELCLPREEKKRRPQNQEMYNSSHGLDFSTSSGYACIYPVTNKNLVSKSVNNGPLAGERDPETREVPAALLPRWRRQERRGVAADPEQRRSWNQI